MRSWLSALVAAVAVCGVLVLLLGGESASSTTGNDPDFDGDGCTDVEELGSDANTGGLRQPTNPWDYFNPTGDGRIRADDVSRVVAQFFIDAGNPAYTESTDRTYTGPYPWSLGPPDGLQRASDISYAVRQYFQDCAGEGSFPSSLMLSTGMQSLEELEKLITVDFAPILQAQVDAAQGKPAGVAAGQSLPNGFVVKCIYPDGTILVVNEQPSTAEPTPVPDSLIPPESEEGDVPAC